jgi:hypothetical protein
MMMMKKLSPSQQMKMLKALPAHRKSAVKSHCQACQMQGQGIGDILKSIGSVLGPIVKEVGPTVLKQFILPFIKKKLAGKSGNGIRLSGAGLRLAGQRGKGLKA